LGISFSASSQHNSRVSTFYYGPFSDNINATLFGSVYSHIKNEFGEETVDSLYEVELLIFDSTNTIFHKILLDTSASYLIEIPGGIYKIIFDKKGYEPLIITNYEAVADQFTQLDIILEKGYKIQKHKIPDWKTITGK